MLTSSQQHSHVVGGQSDYRNLLSVSALLWATILGEAVLLQTPTID